MIVGGLLLGTLLTLSVVPVAYTLLVRKTHHTAEEAAELAGREVTMTEPVEISRPTHDKMRLEILELYPSRQEGSAELLTLVVQLLFRFFRCGFRWIDGRGMGRSFGFRNFPDNSTKLWSRSPSYPQLS